MDEKVSKSTLKNGIRILSVKMPHIHSVSMGVWVNVGARDETHAENGLCHFIEHMIFKGTKKRTAFQIAKEFDAIGGQANAFTAMENTCYHAKVLDTRLSIMVDILSDIFLNSLFDPQEIERERPVVLQEIGMVEDSPDEYIHILSGDTYWGDNPLGQSILGSRENVIRFDSEKIETFFSRFYQPDRIVISAAGNVEHDRFVDLVGPAFESVQPGSPIPDRIAPSGRSLVNLNKRDLEQVHICLSTKGLSITDPNRFAFSLMNTIFGGNMSSRLFQEIRERRGLAYSVYSFIASYDDTGMFGVYAAVEPKKAYETILLVLEQMRKLKETMIDSAELHNAKDYTKGNILLSLENSDNQMARISKCEIHFGRYIPIKEVIDQTESVKASEIKDLAANFFQSKYLSLTMLGPVIDEDKFDDILTLL